MNDYNDLKKQWELRSPGSLPINGPDLIREKGKSIRTGQIIAQIVLGVSCLVLIGFFFYIAAYTNRTVSLGLLLMIGSLLLRIVVEFIFIFRSREIQPDKSLFEYSAKLKRYYKSRLVISYVLTPVLFISYIIGFVILLPFFKQGMSSGFYTYILYSSWVIFAGLAVFIAFQIRKELRMIRELKLETE